MLPRAIEKILHDLGSTDSENAWSEFLEQYSAMVFQVICHFEHDPDQQSDCFQFVCEQLVNRRFRRLRAFRVGGPAKFSTWLRAVIRNLCIDWHRKHSGRRRTFKSIANLSTFDQQVFRLLYERGVSTHEGLSQLIPVFPNVTEQTLAESRQRIETELTPQQRWLLSTRAVNSHNSAYSEEIEDAGSKVIDPRADPETQAIENERYRNLMRGLNRLSSGDRLLIRLRFEQELTLDQIAGVTGLGNAQRVDRQLKQIVSRLKNDV